MADDKSLNQLMKQFGAKLKYYRNLAGLTQEQFAEKTSSATQTISGIESGLYTPSFKKLSKYEKALGIPIVYLFNFDSKNELTEKEYKNNYIKLFNKLTIEQRKMINIFMKSLIEDNEKK